MPPPLYPTLQRVSLLAGATTLASTASAATATALPAAPLSSLSCSSWAEASPAPPRALSAGSTQPRRALKRRRTGEDGASKVGRGQAATRASVIVGEQPAASPAPPAYSNSPPSPPSSTPSAAPAPSATTAAAATPQPAAPAPSEKAGAPEARRARPPQPGPPRPASPYGEINALVRHPTLYEPLLKPRFPIVLCHGLYGFDVRGPGFFRLHYWGDLLKILRGKIGAEVYVTAVPGTGSVKKRAHVLHQSLEDTRELLNRDINFVAHSMGGLDARYLISNIRPTLYHPKSLTTLCTPHRGSEFMSWCRANIGIGTEYEGNEALNLRPSVSASLDEPDDTSIPLPYSLKAPILSREQVLAAKKAAEEAKQSDAKANKPKESSIHLPGLPFNLSASVTGYLLNLLDSPAYANLAPSFLRDVFNPSTPDDPAVKYYSIAARADKVPIWHPLWLPKLVLDGAERARVDSGCAAPPEWRGNDGLVSIESARWGEFLGTFDACDHWEMRGSSGLSSAEASKAAVEQATRREIRDTREPHVGERAEKVDGSPGASEGAQEQAATAKERKDKDKGWQWQDVYALVGKLVGAGNGSGGGDKKKGLVAAKGSSTSAPAPASTSASSSSITSSQKGEPTPKPADDKVRKVESSDADGLASAASWIIRQLPGTSSSPASSSSSSMASKASTASSKAADSAASTLSAVSSSVTSAVSSTVTSAAANVVDNLAHNATARLMYGAPGLSLSASSASSSSSDKSPVGRPGKPEKFDLERMCVALCRKLHNDGF
ncbi:hypothetical protein JCM9279_001539 [Rhodotorula babjevae]